MCPGLPYFCMYSDYTSLTLDEWSLYDAERREKA